MAIYNPLRLAGPAQLGSSATDIYVTPSGKRSVIKQIVFNNTGSSPVTVSAHVIPVGGTANAANQFITGLSIAPNSNIIWSGDIVLNTSGEKLSMLASAATTITYLVNGIEIS